MKMDAELNSQNSSAFGETGGQSPACDSSVAGPHGSETAADAAASPEQDFVAAAARDEGQAKAVVAQPVQPFIEAEKAASAGETGGGNQVGAASVAIASSDVTAANPLESALAALDRRDYATAKRLFEALGRKDAAEAIDNALAALDRKDYATAQGLFEALAPAMPAALAGRAASAAGPAASEPQAKARSNPPISPPVEFIPTADAAYRHPIPQAKKAKKPSLRPLLLGTGLALFAIFSASAIYASRLNWTFAAAKGQAIAGLASAVDLVKAPLEAMTGSSGREEERSEMRELSAALTQVTIRLDQIEHDYGARLDELGQRIDQSSSSRSAEIAARLDELEKKAAAPATPASEFASVVSRLDKLEKRVALQAVSSAKPLPPPAPRKSTSMARAEPLASNEIARLDNPRPVLREYSVEDVQGGVAVIGSRYGVQEVAPGDLIPGAGRVLRIERRGGDWFVLTNRGVIASGPEPY